MTGILVKLLAIAILINSSAAGGFPGIPVISCRKERGVYLLFMGTIVFVCVCVKLIRTSVRRVVEKYKPNIYKILTHFNS